MTYWDYLAGVLSLLLGLYLIVAGYKRQNKAQQHLRAAVSLIAVLLLYLLYLQIARDKTPYLEKPADVLLLTEGTDAKSFEELTQAYPSAPVFTSDPEIGSDNFFKATLIDDPSRITGTTLHVTGYGLSKHQLSLLNGRDFIFHPATLTNNFTAVNWTRQLNAGEKLVVQGTLHNTSGSALTVVLQGFNTKLDSAILPADKAGSFELSTVPKQSGRAVFSLFVLNGKDTIQQQKIPFETIAGTPLKALILAASPDFENKFLKNWLFSNNYGLMVKTMVSKNKFNTEYLNMPDVRGENITGDLLKNFDLIIGDATALQQLPAGVINNIRTSVERDGLGLIIKADSLTPASIFYNRPFRILTTVGNKQALNLNLAADTTAGFPALNIERPFILNNSERVRSIIQDKDGRVFSAVTVAGHGRLLYTTLTNTYPWVLSGDTLAYRRLWSALISEAARKKPGARDLRIEPKFPVTDDAVTLTLNSGDTLPFPTKVNNLPVALQQQFNLPFEWQAQFWPRRNGWQQLMTGDDDGDNNMIYWYCFSKNDWADLRAAERIAENQIRARKNGEIGITNETHTGMANSDLRLYLIIMFIICCSYMWLEEKFHNSR